MKQTFHKKLAVMCLSAVMSLGLCLGVTGILPVSASSASYHDVTEISESYKINTEVIVSDDANAGETVFPKSNIGIANALAKTIKFPDGYERAIGESVKLDQLGKYTITYEADGKLYYDTFKVFDNFSEILGDGYIEKFESDNQTAGFRAVMEPGTIMTFNKVIDLTNVDAESGCVDLFTAKFNTGAPNETFVKYVNILIEDIHDKNTYIKLTLEAYGGATGSTQMYWRASTKDLPDAGLLPNNGSEVLTGNKKGLITYINGVRYKNYHGFCGRYSIAENANYVVRYNPTTQQLFREAAGSVHRDSEIFADLDNVDAYDQGLNYFKGFPSKAVKITLSSIDQAQAYNYEFTQIGDKTGEDLYNLINKGVDDYTAPMLTVDANPTQVGTVYGKLGSFFDIPSAHVVDANKPSEVAIKAYKNYVDASKVYVPFVEKDGVEKLKLTEKTVYTLEYSSVDAYGNLSKYTLNVVPVESTAITGYDNIIDSGIMFGANKISLVTGETCNAKIFELLNTHNSKNTLNLKVDVAHAGKSVFNAEYDANAIASGDLTFDFLPVSVGDYAVTYTVSDNVESITFGYTVNCVANNKINFLEDAFLYKTYMYGMKYDVSSHLGYKFSEELTSQPTTVEISYDDGATWTAVNGKTFVVGADANGEVPLTKAVETIKFKYTCGSMVQETASAPIIDVRLDTTKELSLIANKAQNKVGNIDYSKYFNTDAFDVSSSVESSYRYVFDAKTTFGSATLSLNNPVTFDKKGEFYLAFNTDVNKSQFNKLTISLVDAVDPTNKISMFYEVGQEETLVYTNSSRKFAVNDFPLFSTTEGVDLAKLDFTYSVNNERITTCGKQFTIDFHPVKNIFYVDITLSGISGNNAAIIVTDISNASLTSRSNVDNKAPVLFYQSSAGTYSLGTELPIYAPTVTDFVTPYIHEGHTKIKVTVNNKAVTSVEGVLLDGIKNDPTKTYTLKVTEALIYKVTYIVIDEAGKEDSSATYTIQGADMVDPVITLGYDFNENTIHNVTLGKPFSIDYTIEDDISPAENCLGRVVIIHDVTSREIYTVEPYEYAENSEDYTVITDTCTITIRGMFTVYVYAADEAGNTVYAKYKLNVQ